MALHFDSDSNSALDLWIERTHLELQLSCRLCQKLLGVVDKLRPPARNHYQLARQESGGEAHCTEAGSYLISEPRDQRSSKSICRL